MKTKNKNSIIGIICIIGGALLFQITKEKSEIADGNSNIYLQLTNIEALASNEGCNVYCVGSGSIDCNGGKSASKISAFSIFLSK